MARGRKGERVGDSGQGKEGGESGGEWGRKGGIVGKRGESGGEWGRGERVGESGGEWGRGGRVGESGEEGRERGGPTHTCMCLLPTLSPLS